MKGEAEFRVALVAAWAGRAALPSTVLQNLRLPLPDQPEGL